jgi:hypothetical protein
MITVAGVAFSITIVTLSLASTQYTPRILRNFMRDRANQGVLGVFMGVFTYCLIILRGIRSPFRELSRRRVPLLASGRRNAFARVTAGISGRFDVPGRQQCGEDQADRQGDLIAVFLHGAWFCGGFFQRENDFRTASRLAGDGENGLFAQSSNKSLTATCRAHYKWVREREKKSATTSPRGRYKKARRGPFRESGICTAPRTTNNASQMVD